MKKSLKRKNYPARTAWLHLFLEQVAKFFKDADGRVVIAQWPNVPLWIAIGSWVAARVVFGWDWVLVLLHVGSLLLWAWLEIRAGACGFRKTLGWIVIFWLLLMLVF